MSERSDPPGETPPVAHVAHNARVWNYWLGGKDYYDIDQQVGDHVTSMFPSIREVARADRTFLGHAVRFLAGEAGVRQFLDIGTGLPTVENTHQVAQRVAPTSRIVYVDNDPTVLAHARALLAGSPEGETDYIDADAHQPQAILDAAADTLDFTEPVAVILLGILNFIADTREATEIVETLMAAAPSGSYLVLTHPTLELGGDGNVEAMRFWNENAAPPITARTGAEVARFFQGLELLEPGIVSCARWRPGYEAEDEKTVAQFGAVARKP
ncbi:SAM-dependent methyltransferase [Streptomyces spirodelae]|uniref:SAM-dependent methyltransferase n=1 Tax=Streptomyces spirodelae TaxID=2812904 RepID=A0ABS3X2Z9_9ACTN|nr:SAM-dependent methyltransferase [Streptomyces spirodelae]MBO8189758.1 SAM-dependent methyltransferase [Streptomyces spirodelae]